MLLEEVGVGEKYIKKQLLGNGGFAKCYLMINTRTQQKFAGKIIRKRQLRDKASKAKVGIKIDRMTDHPNVVKIVETFQFEGEMYIILELCQNNSLKEFLRNRVRITQFEAKCYLLQVVQGLQYLHAAGIVHRDIKLGNIFLNYKMEIKIGDFGLSTKIRSPRDRRFTTCGTPNYIAPQILSEVGHGFEVDIWALGIMIYALLIGKPPFESQTVDETYKRIKNNQYDFPKQVPVSTEAKSLIKALLQPNPKMRITLQQIKTHQFLANQNIPPLMPPYTISLPPQSNFLKQFVSERYMKLAIYPRKISALTGMPQDINSNSNTNLKINKYKLNRVLSCDKNIFKMSIDNKLSSRDRSQLNRGIIFNTKMKNHLKQSSRIKTLLKTQTEAGSVRNKYQADGNEIICYYDMSSKYGIGYLLSNGNYGTVFNDQTSLVLLVDNTYLYNDKKIAKFQKLPNNLAKKGDILKLCIQKLEGYRQKNVLIPFQSEVLATKFVKFKEFLVMKLNNGILQFFWSSDCITVKGFKWIKWRIGRDQGENSLSSPGFPSYVQQRITRVRQFLQQYSQKDQRRRSDI